MNLGPRGAALIKRYETLSLVAYLPTPDDVPTIGWGHTRGVKMGDTITREQAEHFFTADVADAVDAVNVFIGRGVKQFSQSQFDALVSLAFNAGAASISRDSTIGRALVAGKPYDAWAAFALWRKQAGKDLRGLAARRAAEMALYVEDKLPSTT